MWTSKLWWLLAMWMYDLQEGFGLNGVNIGN
jgi:hypothetical protein